MITDVLFFHVSFCITHSSLDHSQSVCCILSFPAQPWEQPRLMQVKSPTVFVLLPTWVEGRVNSNLVDNAAAGNLHHPTSSFSFFGGQRILGTYSNLVACGSSAFNMDSLKAGLETIHTISCKHVDIRGRVNQLKGKVEHWEKELNQIKLTFAIDTPIQKRKLIS